MNEAVDDPRPASDRLTPDDLPRLALFLAGYLHEDFGSVHGSAQHAAWDYAAEAELDELQELANDWQVLRAASLELPLAELNRALRERFGSSWQALSRDELAAIGDELERALRE